MLGTSSWEENIKGGLDRTWVVEPDMVIRDIDLYYKYSASFSTDTLRYSKKSITLLSDHIKSRRFKKK